MIAYLFVLLAATPIFGLSAEYTPKEHEVQESANKFEQKPIAENAYPNIPYYIRKTESAVVEVPLTPDAIVIPYSQPNYPSYQNYHYYPNVGSRNQVPAPYQYSQYNQYPYVPESYLVVPTPNIQRVNPTSYVPEYESVPRLLYYLPKSYYPTGYQTPIHQSQQEFQTQGQTAHQVARNTIAGVVPQGETLFETVKPVEGTQHQ